MDGLTVVRLNMMACLARRCYLASSGRMVESMAQESGLGHNQEEAYRQPVPDCLMKACASQMLQCRSMPDSVRGRGAGRQREMGADAIRHWLALEVDQSLMVGGVAFATGSLPGCVVAVTSALDGRRWVSK